MDNLELIKDRYFKCHGSFFHMAREYREEYELYKRVNPGEDILKAWDTELLESLFGMLWEDPGFVWVRHSRIIRVLNSGRVDIDYWASRLLDEMEKMVDLDKQSKIIIIETMSGRNSKEDKGGVHLICTETDLESRMSAIMNKLMDFRCDYSDNIDEIGWDNVLNRYLVAVGSYKKACRKYGK